MKMLKNAGWIEVACRGSRSGLTTKLSGKGVACRANPETTEVPRMAAKAGQNALTKKALTTRKVRPVLNARIGKAEIDGQGYENSSSDA